MDQIGTDPNGYNEYYNGRPTIAAKVGLADSEGLGGIMIWEVAQDSFDQYSLLTTIATTYATLNAATFDASVFKVYPNPTKDILTIAFTNQTPIESVEIHNYLGKNILNLTQINAMNTTVSLSDFSAGIYFAKITSGDQQTVVKIIKQ